MPRRKRRSERKIDYTRDEEDTCDSYVSEASENDDNDITPENSDDASGEDSNDASEEESDDDITDNDINIIIETLQRTDHKGTQIHEIITSAWPNIQISLKRVREIMNEIKNQQEESDLLLMVCNSIVKRRWT